MKYYPVAIPPPSQLAALLLERFVEHQLVADFAAKLDQRHPISAEIKQ